MNDGSEQGRRYPPALEPGRAAVDDFAFEDLIAMSAGLARRLRFFGPDNIARADQTWAELFQRDETLVMAEIAAFDITRYLPLHDAVEASAPESAADRLLTLAVIVNRWLAMLRPLDSPAAQAMMEIATRLIEQRLAPELGWVMACRQAAWSGALMRSVERLDARWAMPATVPPQPLDLPRLRGSVHVFRSGIARLKAAAQEQMLRSLHHRSHEPAAGLLLAFTQLFQTVQGQMNRFADRHIDFYYGDCLRMRPRTAACDQVHIVCRTDPALRELVVPAGTRFSAGKGLDGLPLVYASDEDTVLTPVQVSAVCTVRVERHPLISPEDELGFATRIKSAQLPIPIAPGAAADVVPPHWPLFGGTASQPGAGQAEEAHIGLAIASPILLLAEGERDLDINLRVSFLGESDEDAAALVRAHAMDTGDSSSTLEHLFLHYFALDPSLLGEEAATSEAARSELVERLVARVLPRLNDGDGEGAHYRCFLTELLLESRSKAEFATRFGKLCSRWLLGDPGWMSARDLLRLRRLWRMYGPNSLAHVRTRVRHRHAATSRPGAVRELLFSEFFGGIFEVNLSVAQGWFVATNVCITQEMDNGAPVPGGLKLSIKLLPRDPPVVACGAAHAAMFHGVALPTAAPVVLLRLRAEARLCPYSLLADAMLDEARLSVNVRGLRGLALSNQLGRLDASKPFNPFGPLPVRGSYLVFGSAEAAAKNLTALTLNCEWADLPEGEGGFRSHYEGYESRLDNRSFTAAIALLRDGQWHPREALLTPQLLFRSDPLDDRLRSRSSIRIESGLLRNDFRAATAPLPADQFLFGPAVGDGFFKLQLTGPAGAFGHQEYPGLLTKVLTANARKKHPDPVPRQPYTPLLERITIDYSAQTSIVLGRASLAEAAGSANTEQVFVLHPFGMEQIHPAQAKSARWLLPRFPRDGNLCIGLTADDISGRVSLHFHLRDESARQSDGPRAKVRWEVLCQNRWLPLAPERVMFDTTRGFLTSGIVTLDLPPEMSDDNTVMPSGLYWLRAGCDARFESFASLYAIRAQALQATLMDPAQARTLGLSLPAGTIRELVAPLAGLLAIEQIGPSFGRRAAETPREMRTRVSERLAHRNRCVSPWDYERMVLEEFPQVCKAKCFPNLGLRGPGPAPGQLLVVVIPSFDARSDEAVMPTPRLNADQLDRIAEFVRSHASPFASVQVCNAAYERIQVRCTVRIRRDHPVGLSLRRINQAIVRFLSPWDEGGLGVHFDWVIQPVDVESRLRRIDAVESVTRLSLLQVASTDETLYWLGDSARPADGTIKARRPWSIAVPMAQHIIEVAEPGRDLRAEESGLRILELGNTFVVGGARHG